MSEASQAEVVAFLSDPGTHGGAAVEQVETHISRIFLAGDLAWKLKRALRTNYLDFSTPALREASCRRELEVNADAEDLYLAVVPVARRGGRLHLGGEGQAIDWLVEMRRFDRAGELDRLCDRGALDRETVERLADTVVALHARAPETPAYGDNADVKARIEQIAGALRDAAADPGIGGRAEAWREAAEAARRVQAGLIARRRFLGRVRRCHGDLHLGNVVMLDDRPVPFDAIEFNEAIASIDTLYDLALVLADLGVRGRPDLASALLNRYLGVSRDYGGMPLMPLFLSMRGAILAMTAAARGELAAARRALAFAEDCLRPQPPARLVAVGGRSGSGKSTLARALAPALAPLVGAIVLRSDVTRKRLCGAAPEDPLPPSAYSAATDRKVLARLAFEARRLLRVGFAVILDATFLGPDWRACAEAVARGAGVRFDGLWHALDGPEAARRIGLRAADASDATPDIALTQAARAAAPPGWHILDAARPREAVRAAAEGALDMPASFHTEG